jgi:hypothetical protein
MIKSEKLQILELSNKRYEFIKKQEDSWDPNEEKYGVNYDHEIDQLGSQISNLLKKWRDFLSFEFILVELTKLGQSPSLLYDDNGHFALYGDGIQTVSTGDSTDVKMAFWVPKQFWKETPRLALEHYLDFS